MVMVLAASIAVVCTCLLGRIQSPPAISGNAAVRGSATGDAENAAAAKMVSKVKTVTGSHRSATLPPPGAPLKDTFAELQTRANANDVAAAMRLYRDLSLCNRFRGMDKANSSLADELLNQQVDAMNLQQIEGYAVQLDAIESRKQVMQKFHTLCDGASGDMLDSLVPDLRQAALLGEEYARSCYLQRGPAYDTRRLVNHPEWLDDYRDSVQSLIGSGIAAGDWKVVDILQNAYAPDSDSALAGVLGADPYRYYRYLKLYRLGAEPYRAGQLNQQLIEAAALLSPAQLAEADEWAQATFQQNFNASSSTESTITGWDPCSFPYE